MEFIFFSLLGLLVGAVGTLVGAGGGFLLVPVLIFLYPRARPEWITAISMAVVFFNSASGTVAYAFRRRVDYKSGVIFIIASIPGAILGVRAAALVSRQIFDPIFGGGLILTSLFLLSKKNGDMTPRGWGQGLMSRDFTDSQGTHYRYSFDMRIGVLISVFIGFLASFLGIGGGIIHVPVLVHLLAFPVFVATATSHFVVSFMSLAACIDHYVSGHYAESAVQLLALAPSAAIGAQLGAYLSHRVSGLWIMRLLAVALLMVGVRLLWGAI